MKHKTFHWIFNKIRHRIPGMLLLIGANAGSAVLSVVFALGTRNVIDTAISGDRLSFFAACRQQLAIIIGILLCTFIMRHLTERLKADLDRDWKQVLLHRLLRGDYTAVSQYHSGELINRLNNDVRIVDDGLIGSVPGVVAMIARLVGAMAVLIGLEPWFALAVLAAGVSVIVVTGFMRRKLKVLHKKVSAMDGKVSSFLQETLEKLLMVQAMDASREMEHRADELMEQRYLLQRKRKNVSLFANTSINVMSYGAGFVALVWCAGKLLAGTMSFGSLTAVTNLVSQLQSPFVSLSGVIPQFISMIASAERLMELEDIPTEQDVSEVDRDAVYRDLVAVCGENIAFSYDRDQVLNLASFSVPKGAFAAVTGPSGIGKSTLLKLLLGIFKPDAGEIYLQCGDKKIRADRSTRKLFAYVPQGNLLLSGTLRENLLIADQNATQSQIHQALYVSAMDEWIQQLPKGLDTPVGESGAGISEGQAQRLAIARAILSGAPILLLDESTSALDSHTERVVLERIRSLQDRTCIAVTHRPAAMELCDLQLRIDGEQILQVSLTTEE